MTRKTKILILVAVLLILVVVLIVWIIRGNTVLELNTYTITSDKLPEAFNGYRIAHISDLHNTQMGQGNEDLLEMLRSVRPDMIAITGDLIDSRNTNLDVALQFVAEAVKIAPCYYVTGNHEARVAQYPSFKESLENLGVVVLADEKIVLKRDEQSISLIGVNDPLFSDNYNSEFVEGQMAETLSRLHLPQDTDFSILLSHRPNLFDPYVDADIDLVLSGHAHGGQFRLPLVGGLYVPSQGFFPEYDAGLFTEGNTNMIVSRGIGNSTFPFRFNNPPEVILIELRTQ